MEKSDNVQKKQCKDNEHKELLKKHKEIADFGYMQKDKIKALTSSNMRVLVYDLD